MYGPKFSDDPKTALVGFAVILAPIAMVAACTVLYGGSSQPPRPATPAASPSDFSDLLPTASPWSGIRCRDGWISHSTGRGTCSHHGGEAW